MTHQEKINALMAAVNDSIVLPPIQRKVIQQALVEGFIRILYAEEAEARARQPYTYIPVELSADQGFLIWNSGGFDGLRNSGEAQLCIGLDGRHTRITRTMRERNGRHELAVIYQGSYVIRAKVTDSLATPIITMYQVIGFCSRDGAYQARCQRVYSNTGMDPKLTAEQMDRYAQAIGLCGDVSCTANLYRMEWP